MNHETLEYAQAALSDLRDFLAQKVEPRREPVNDLRHFDDIKRDYEYRRPEGHWFDRDAMRFFSTRPGADSVRLPALGVTLFTTTEQDRYASGPRRTSIRAYRWADADITTLGPFCEHTPARAKASLAWIAEQLA